MDNNTSLKFSEDSKKEVPQKDVFDYDTYGGGVEYFGFYKGKDLNGKEKSK